MTLPDTVRQSCRDIVADARLVRIDDDALASWAASFSPSNARTTAAADRLLLPNESAANPERAMALSLAATAVNFTSGWHDIMPKRPGLSGAVSTITRLADYERATGPLTPARLCAITSTDASQIFETPQDGGALEDLLDLLRAALNQLGGLGSEHRSFENLVVGCAGSAATLAARLAPLPSFADIGFYKRAQMAAAALTRELGPGYGPTAFTDLDELTIFADNLVPHVLRLDGVLHFDARLVEQINNRELLPAGGEAEREIRAAAVEASERIVACLEGRITAADLDHALWLKGGQSRYKAHPRHRCRNPFY